jgi:hypothetical protein
MHNVVRRWCLGALASMICVCFGPAHAVEVPNGGWSNGYVRILEMYSVWSFTRIRIGDVASCGESNNGWWVLPKTKNSEVLDKALAYKKSILLAAFVTGKNVQFRCENGELTDFSVRE